MWQVVSDDYTSTGLLKFLIVHVHVCRFASLSRSRKGYMYMYMYFTVTWVLHVCASDETWYWIILC